MPEGSHGALRPKYTVMSIFLSLHNKQNPDWVQLIERIYQALDFPNNPDLLPPQFAQVTFPKIGGQVAVVRQDTLTEQPAGVGFLFPHGHTENQRTYLLRYYPITTQLIDLTQLILLLKAELTGARVILFDPHTPNTYGTTTHSTGPHPINETLLLARPTAPEAEEIRQIHQQIWGSPLGYLYPAEMHAVEFGAGTSLVARALNREEGNQVVGFLLGFRRFDGSHLPADWHDRLRGGWRIESQSMGVLPEFRGQRVGYHLKQKQAELARAEGVHIIHWTADPLQFRNAALNFGLLRAVAFDFHADLYPFRNELNRVAASRFSLTWLINASRVCAMETQRAQVIDLSQVDTVANDIVRINDGPKQLVTETDAARIAVEIPVDWSAVQHGSLDEAQQWRSATDAIFEQFIGRERGQYVITDIAVDGERCYLIGCRVSSSLWDQLSCTESAG